jgi:hypothetical protein
MDIRFGTWNVTSFYGAGLLITVAEEISKYVWFSWSTKVIWDTGDTKPTRKYTLFYGKGNENHELGAGFSYIRESYKQLRG